MFVPVPRSFTTTRAPLARLTNCQQLYHLEDDLHIKDDQYLLALTIFFFRYGLFANSLGTSRLTHARCTVMLSSRCHALSMNSGKVPYVILGPVQRLPETPSSLALAVWPYVTLGSDDGMSATRLSQHQCSIGRQTVQGLVHNFGGLMGKAYALDSGN